jgi:glycosyltransferase involved in cell wall biosynthesis
MPGFASVRPRRLLLLGAGLDAASWRFRVEQYLPHLRALGIRADVGELRAPLPQRLRVLSAAARYDAVCVHRALLAPFEHRWLRRCAPRYVFDFDDAIMLRDSAAARQRSWQRRRRFARMVRGAGAVVAGNAYLAAWAQRYRVDATTIPTAVDLGSFAGDGAGASGAVVGWIGTRSNLLYVRTVVPALRRLSARRPEMRIKIVCDGELAADGLPLTNEPWSRGGETAALRSFQVGIMPLPDDPWTRGKCAVKILQYFAARLPAVCSPVGANLEVVEHGGSGYFASTADEWVARIDELLGDAALRRRFGEHGRAVVEQRYSTEVVLPQLLRVLFPQDRD